MKAIQLITGAAAICALTILSPEKTNAQSSYGYGYNYSYPGYNFSYPGYSYYYPGYYYGYPGYQYRYPRYPRYRRPDINIGPRWDPEHGWVYF